jgi:hydrogenase-1 operon protein HyaF
MTMLNPVSPIVRSLLEEVASLLDTYSRSGLPSAIDLTSLPITPEDNAALDEALGRGNVEAVVAAGGMSEVIETGFSGVWRVRHFDKAEKLKADRLEITAVPELLLAHGDDIAAAARRLRDSLAADTNSPARETILGQ